MTTPHENAMRTYFAAQAYQASNPGRSCATPTPVTPHVLVAVASKHGATADIGREIARVLTGHDIEVTVADLEQTTDPAGYDAVVVGSAVYAGHWLKPAREFVRDHSQTLASQQVWLFSSGPIGQPPRPAEEPADLTTLLAQTAALDHRIFAGRLDRNRLGFAEKAVVLALHAPEGDFRDWMAVRAWAGDIARTLTSNPASSAVTADSAVGEPGAGALTGSGPT
jgi:menaquinone-dependent protoporphyrinogen oxidase